MTIASIMLVAACALVATPPAARAQSAEAWPGACICKSTDPRAASLRYAVFRVEAGNLAAFKARFAEIGNAPLNKAISVPNACPEAKICVDRKQVAADEPAVTLKVIGIGGDPDLFDGSNVLDLERLKPGVPLVLYGARQ